LYFNTLTAPSIDLYAVNRPGNGLTQRLPQHRPAGLSDGRQTLKCPLTRTALPQLAHKDAVRKEDHIHVPGLALAASKLTVAHAQMLLAVPMEALRPTPTAAVNAEYSTDLPKGAIGNEYLNWFIILLFIPKYHNPQFMINAINTDRFSKIPLFMFPEVNRPAVVRRNTFGQFIGFDNLAAENHPAIEFQIGDIAFAFGIYMVEILAMSKPAIEGKISRDVIFDNPINKLPEKNIVISELALCLKALLFLDEASELKRIMFSGSADIIGDEVVVGNLETLLGMIPERTDIFNECANMVDEDIIKGNNTLIAVGGRRVFLQPSQAFGIEFFDIPVGSGNPAIQTGLVGGNGKLAVDARNVFMISDKQTGEILGEMNLFRLVCEQVAELSQSFFDDGWEFDDRRHRYNLHVFTEYAATGIYRQNAHLNLIFSILQKSS